MWARGRKVGGGLGTAVSLRAWHLVGSEQWVLWSEMCVSLRAGQAGAAAVQTVLSMRLALFPSTARHPLPASMGNVPVLLPRWRNKESREAAVLWQHRALNPQFIPFKGRLFGLMYGGGHV